MFRRPAGFGWLTGFILLSVSATGFPAPAGWQGHFPVALRAAPWAAGPSGPARRAGLDPLNDSSRGRLSFTVEDSSILPSPGSSLRARRGLDPNALRAKRCGKRALPALVIGLDRSDRKADLHFIETASGKQWSQTIETKPEALHDWLAQLRQQYPEAKIGLCVEQPAGAIIAFVEAYAWITIHAINEAKPRPNARGQRVGAGTACPRTPVTWPNSFGIIGPSCRSGCRRIRPPANSSCWWSTAGPSSMNAPASPTRQSLDPMRFARSACGRQALPAGGRWPLTSSSSGRLAEGDEGQNRDADAVLLCAWLAQ